MKPYYEHAGVTLFHGDWRECGLAEMPKFDLLLTDPPYGIGEAAGKNSSRSNLAVSKNYGNMAWDNKPPSQSDIQSVLFIANKQILFGGNYFPVPPSRCWLVWDKLNSGDFADCELAWTNLDMAVRQFRYMWNGMLRENRDEKRFHPTQKPLSLMKWCLSLVPTAKSVVDPYCSSGTTLVAAKAMGLTAVGCEREEQYCEIAVERLRQETLF